MCEILYSYPVIEACTHLSTWTVNRRNIPDFSTHKIARHLIPIQNLITFQVSSICESSFTVIKYLFSLIHTLAVGYVLYIKYAYIARNLPASGATSGAASGTASRPDS